MNSLLTINSLLLEPTFHQVFSTQLKCTLFFHEEGALTDGSPEGRGDSGRSAARDEIAFFSIVAESFEQAGIPVHGRRFTLR